MPNSAVAPPLPSTMPRVLSILGCQQPQELGGHGALLVDAYRRITGGTPHTPGRGEPVKRLPGSRLLVGASLGIAAKLTAEKCKLHCKVLDRIAVTQLFAFCG